MFDMLVVDLLHEVELGVWKAIFIHLLRLLDCVDGKSNRCIVIISQLYNLDPIVIQINNKYSSFILSLILLLEVDIGGLVSIHISIYIILAFLCH